MAVIGIDLGTTNSLAAVWRNGRSELITNAFGEFMTPSVIIANPKNTVSKSKRFMGTNKVYELGGRRNIPEELFDLVLKKLKEDALLEGIDAMILKTMPENTYILQGVVVNPFSDNFIIMKENFKKLR